MSALVVDTDYPRLGERATATFGLPQRCARDHNVRPNTACAGCHPYRYQLTRIWDPAVTPATFIMLNPSTADAFTEDATVRRCVGFARQWGCGGVVVLNLFALRSTDPRALYRHDDPVGPDNGEVIGGYLTRITRADPPTPAIYGPVVAAWGHHGTHLNRAQQVARMVAERGIQLHALAVTKAGHPGHPLYLPKTSPLVPYEPPAPAAA